jgi:hypothetical protein
VCIAFWQGSPQLNSLSKVSHGICLAAAYPTSALCLKQLASIPYSVLTTARWGCALLVSCFWVVAVVGNVARSAAVVHREQWCSEAHCCEELRCELALFN